MADDFATGNPLARLAEHLLIRTGQTDSSATEANQNGQQPTQSFSLRGIPSPQKLRRSSVTRPSSPLDIGTANPSAIVDVGHSLSNTHASYRPQHGTTLSRQIATINGTMGAGHLTPRQQELVDIFNEAQTAWTNQDYPIVLQDIQTIEALAPDDAETRRLLATTYFTLAQRMQSAGDRQAVQQSYAQARKLDPDNPDYLKWQPGKENMQ